MFLCIWVVRRFVNVCLADAHKHLHQPPYIQGMLLQGLSCFVFPIQFCFAVRTIPFLRNQRFFVQQTSRGEVLKLYTQESLRNVRKESHLEQQKGMYLNVLSKNSLSSITDDHPIRLNEMTCQHLAQKSFWWRERKGST